MSTMSLREAYGKSLVEAGTVNKNVVVLEADLRNSTRTVLFRNKFPDRFFEMGIAEQNMASTAAGFALAGKIPFMNSFAVFASGRAYDQIRNSICIPRLSVRICGSSSGLSDFGDGKTHQAVEDVALMRAIPNMTVLVPVDAIEMEKMVEASINYNGPVYFRVNRNDLPVYTDPSIPYRIGEMNVIRQGSDVVIFSNGVMISKSMEASEKLAGEGISVKIVNVSTVKPLDKKAVLSHIEGAKGVVAAEEHSVIGGLGSAIAEVLRMNRKMPLDFVGIEDSFGLSALNYEELLLRYGLSSQAVIRAVRTVLDS